MNTILWLMYLADLSTSISSVCIIVGIVLLVTYVVRWFNNEIEYGNTFSKSMPNKKLLIVVVCLISFAAILPSKMTIYSIAAVQAGNTFADTERGKKVLNALDKWLADQSK